jgi:hypothetical protein
VTLVVTLRALLPTVDALARASPLTAAERALPLLLREEQLAVYVRRWQCILLLDTLLLLLLHEEQLAVYTRRWQCILLGTILCRAQPATDVFKRQLRQVLGNFNHDGHLGEMLGNDTQKFLNYLLFLDLLSQRAKHSDQAAEMHGEIIDSLTLLEADALNLSPQPLCSRVSDSLAVDASISCSTVLVIASSAMRSSCSVTSSVSMASQRFLACSLIFMISAHSV